MLHNCRALTDPSEAKVIVGSDIATEGLSVIGAEFEVESYRVHPDYDDATQDCDLGILVVKGTFDLSDNSFTRTLNIAAENSVADKYDVSGFGTRLQGVPAGSMVSTTVTLLPVSNEDCLAALQALGKRKSIKKI